MKKYFYTLLILISSITTLQAQGLSNVKELLSKGNEVFVEVVDKNKNTDGAYESFKSHLLGDEWNRWVLVENKESANFICRLIIEKKGFNLMSFTSYGARVPYSD